MNWLNEPVDDAGHRRVRELLRCVRVVTSNWITTKDEDDGDDVLVYSGPKQAYIRAQRKILLILRRYKFSPLMVSFGGTMIKQWTPVAGPEGRFKRRWPPTDGKYDDVQAVYELTWLTRGEGIERIGECGCGKWFFAKFTHQRFCSTKCREKAFRSSPEWKEYRRRKAREYYWLHKSGKVK